MAGMKFTADVNVEDIIKLRQEIDKLKKSLIAIAGIPNSDSAIKQLEKEIAAATKKLEEYENKYLQIQKLKHDIDSSNDAVKKAKEETAALQSTNKWIVANTEAVIETDKQIKQLKKSFVALADSEKTGTSGIGILRQVQQLAAQRLVEEEAVRKTIKAQKDQIIQSKAEEGSITALRKQIILLTKDYDDLGRTRRNGDAGKALLAQIANVQKELSAAEQASGRFQRNVGNYASAWNGLGFSVQQVARELPSLAVSANTFFLAISNNLPILVDEIAKARKEYAAFKAELAAGNKDVKAVAPVWQQLTKSLISWQTALVVGLTLLSVYGKEIINWGKELVRGKNYVLDLSTAEQELAAARKKGIQDSIKERLELDLLYTKLKSASTLLKERTASINEWISKYPQYANVINEEKIDIDKLSIAYRALGKEMMQRSIYQSYMDRAKDISNQIVDQEIKLRNQTKTLKEANKRVEEANKRLFAAQKNESDTYSSLREKNAAQREFTEANKNLEEQARIYSDINNNVSKLKGNLGEFINSIDVDKLFPQPKEGTYDYWQQQVQLADTALKQIKDTYLKTLKSGNTNGVPEEVVKQYNALIKQKTEAEEKLKLYDDKGLTKEYNSIVDQQKKISELLYKQATERKRKEQDLENQLTQSRIDAMAEGEAKIRAQRELDNKKEIQDLERQREDYIRTEIELQRKAFDEQENLRAKQTKNYKKRTFDASAVKVDTSAFDKILNNTILRQDIYPYQEEMKYWNEYLKEYGTFQQKKAAINEEYNLKISEATTKGAKKSLEKEKENKLKEVSFEELKSSINFANIFGNLDAQSTEALVKMRDNLKEVINKAAKDIKPTDLKALQDAFKEIDLKITVRNPLGELKNSADNYRNATSAVIKAQEDLNTVIQGGEVITKVYTNENGKLTTRLLTLTQAENNLAAAQSDRQKALSKLTQAANSIGQKGMEVVNAGNDVVGMLENFGVKVPETISKTLDGIGQVMSGLERIDLTKPFSAITGAVSVLAGVGNTIAGLFGFGGADYSRYNEMVDEYNKLNEIWDELIDKKKEYIDMSYGPEAAKAGDEAIEIANKSIESYKILGRERLQSGASAGSHSIGVRIRNSMSQELWDQWDEFAKSIGKDPDFIGGRLSGLFNLTAEQLEKLKEEAPGFWSKLDGDVQNYLNKIIEGGERIEDIQKAVQEQLTQTSFDSLFDNFIDTLMDMDASSKDFADNFGEYMRKAVFTQMFAKGYEDELRKWYESFSEAMGKEGGITSSDIKDLREGWDTIVNGALEDRKAWEQIVGGGGTSTSQESSKKGFATMSQDSADELNGRFTALQIAGEEIKNQNQLQTMSILELKAGMLTISANSSGIKDIASETRDLIRLSYEAITDIRDNTNVMVKPIQQMAADIAEVKRNTNGLSKK
jgi:putative tape measure domain protein